MFSCKKKSNDDGSLLNIIKDSTASLVAMKEADYRPLYHFTPPLKWMNDPNGLVYYKGKYHLFYQYNPNGNVWGPMHWGHTTSTDLFNWQDQNVALAPDNTGAIFSGSAVVDANNTSGFKSGSEDPLVAVYTLAGSQQHQAIAYSNDGGANWTKHAANPVLPNPGIPDFRDPKVFWHASKAKWIMTLAAGNKASFYSSADLKSWAFESSFGENVGAHGGVWECPDLFELPVEGTNTSKWVLLVSINPGGPNGGSATQYFVGNFDGKTFTSETSETLWLDYGTDNYAGVTYNNIPSADGRRVLIGWMSNWNYAQQVPTTSWRSTMTVPRVLTLAKPGTGYVLRSKPVDELANYKTGTPDTTITTAVSSLQALDNKIIKSGSYEITFSADMSATGSLVLTLGNVSEKLVISVDKANSQLIVDRGASGNVDFNGGFKQKIICPFVPKTGQLTDFQILVDKTSLELFVDKGERAVTALFFPNYQYTFLKLQGDGSSPVISNFKLKGINKSMR
jgi:sucrose-6-phosphate hydrolase SacC (GH32 family)